MYYKFSDSEVISDSIFWPKKLKNVFQCPIRCISFFDKTTIPISQSQAASKLGYLIVFKPVFISNVE